MDRRLTRREWSGPAYSVVDMNWPPELGIEHMIVNTGGGCMSHDGDCT